MRSLLSDNAAERRTRSEHLESVDSCSNLARVIVDEPHRLVLVLTIVLHIAHNHLSRVSGAVDEQLSLSFHAAEITVNPPEKSDTAQGGDQQD